MVVPHKILRAPSERHATHSPHPHVCARPPIKRFSDAVPRRAGEAEAAAIFGDVSRSFAPDAAPFRECVRAPLATAEKSITGRKTVCVRHRNTPKSYARPDGSRAKVSPLSWNCSGRGDVRDVPFCGRDTRNLAVEWGVRFPCYFRMNSGMVYFGV